MTDTNPANDERARLQAALDEANKSLSAFIDLFGRTDAYADVLSKAMRAIVGRSQNGTLGTSKVDDMRRLAEDAIAAAPKATADADWVAVKRLDLLEAIGTLRGFHTLTGDASLQVFADRLAAQMSPADRAALPANTNAVDFMSEIEALRKASVDLANLGPQADPSRVAEAKSRYVDCVNSLYVLSALSRFNPLDDHK